MKYYSRSREEIQKRQNQNQKKYSDASTSTKKRKIGRVLILLDVVIVAFVFAYLIEKDKIKQVFFTNQKNSIDSRGTIEEEINKNFQFLDIKLISSCQKTIGCHLRWQYLNQPRSLKRKDRQKNFTIQYVQWKVFNKNSIVDPIHVSNQEPVENTNHFFFNILSEHIILVSLTNTTLKKQLATQNNYKEKKIQVFP